MKKISTIQSPEDFLNTVSKKILQTDIVLDIGSGIQPQKYIKPVVHICAEPYEEYAQELLKNYWKWNSFFVILKQKWNQVIETIPENGVDTVITLDVIEHLEKQEAQEILEKTILIARKQVIIFTPYWFLPQEVPEGMKDAWGLDGAEWQKHKSGWTENDFSEDWDIYICPEFHFHDAITGKKHEKPYGAMFAILTKQHLWKENIYSYMRKIYSFFTLKLPLTYKTNTFLYNPVIKFLYRKVFLKIKQK